MKDRQTNMKIPLAIFVGVALALAAACASSSPRSGRVLERWETTNKTFKVRVTAYGEQDWIPAPAGAYYVFESATADSDQWKEIMIFKHDDPVKIPREQVRFVNDQIGYVFMVWMYAVTTDGGRTWFTWDAIKDLPQWGDHPPIKELHIAADGSGAMRFAPFNDKHPVPELHTQDYGQHWSSE